jgi:hypothetical protein
MAAGWVAITLPETLGKQGIAKNSTLRLLEAPDHRRMRRELLERFPELISRDAKEIVLLTELNMARLLDEERAELHQEFSSSSGGRSLYALISSWIPKKMKKKIRRHLPDWTYDLLSRMRR